MIKIDYTNISKDESKIVFSIKYLLNYLRSWYYFKIKWSWVKYNGFTRVMKGTTFAKRDIKLGHKVQFGLNVLVATDVVIGNDVLIAGNVSFVGKHDHTFDIPGKTIWDSPRGVDSKTIVEDDVWIGNNSTIIGGVKIGTGSIVSAGSVVTKEILPCEIWGGVPAKKIKDRFLTKEDKDKHLKTILQRKNG